MITFIIFYWIFSSFIILGAIREMYTTNLVAIICAFLFGGILFPIKLGMVLEQIRKILSKM